jgi:uncharacterized membrane protein YGL010W
MKTLVEHLSQYAAYHRDPRNITTHFVGVPMILLAVVILLSRPFVEIGGITLSPALLLALVSAVFYLRLDLRFGIVMSIQLGLSVAVAAAVAAAPTMFWLTSGLGLFLIGWVIQFIGHFYEGRKPAFVDDIMGLMIGPLFVMAELGFLFGLRKEVQAQIERVAGPIRTGEINKIGS